MKHGQANCGLVGYGKEQDAGGVDMRGLEDFVPGDVAPYTGEPIGREPAVHGVIDLDYHKRNAGAVKDARGRLSASAIAGDDHVIAVRFGEWLDRRRSYRGGPLASPGTSHGERQPRDERRQGHCEDRARKNEIIGRPREHARTDAGAREDERELAYLGEAKPNDPRRHVDVAESPDEKADEDGLADEGKEYDGSDLHCVLYRKTGIKQHADTDEEEEAEDIADWYDVAQGLVAEFRFTEDEASDERAKRKGQAA